MLNIAELSSTQIFHVAAMPGGYDIVTEKNGQPSVPVIGDDDASRADHTVPSPLHGARSPPACSRKPDHFHNIEDIPSCKARLDAVIKRLAANRDNMAIVSLFAWGRMTFTIKDGEARELWKPKRAEALAIFAYLYVNRNAVFADVAPGYELIFEDASTLRSTVGVTVPSTPEDDYIALQKELDKHWGVHKRKMCPALRLPSALRRPLSPSMIMGLGNTATTTTTTTTTTTSSVYNAAAPAKTPTSPAHSSPAMRVASPGHLTPKQGASSPPLPSMDHAARKSPNMQQQQQEHQWTFVGSYQRRPQLAVAIPRVKGVNNNNSSTVISTPQGRVFSSPSYHMHPYARDAHPAHQQPQRLHAPVRYPGAPLPRPHQGGSPQQTVPTEVLTQHMGAAAQSPPRGAVDSQDTECAAVTLLLMASGAGSPPRSGPNRSEDMSAYDSMDSTDMSRSSTPETAQHQHSYPSAAGLISHAVQHAEHGAHWRPW